MRPFLVLDNWHEPQEKNLIDAYLNSSGLPVEVLRAPFGEFPETADYCGVYVSPSFCGAYDRLDWIEQEHFVLKDLADAEVPIMGLCFGCQILASALVGREQVFKRDEREWGFREIRLTEAAEDDPISRDMPKSMAVFHWHGDEVRAEHSDIVVLAESDGCANQIWRWSRGYAWGVQPHPEFDLQGLMRWFESNREIFEESGLSRKYLETGSEIGCSAFGFLKNFIDFVISREAANVSAK